MEKRKQLATAFLSPTDLHVSTISLIKCSDQYSFDPEVKESENYTNEMEPHTESVYVTPMSNDLRKTLNEGAQVRLPELQLAPWGSSWSKDIVVFLQNALLCEIRDLYLLGRILQQKKFVLSRSHIELFYSWFGLFHEFALICLRVEEEYVMQWISVGGDVMLRGSTGESQRMLYYGSVRRTLEKIAAFQEQFHPHLPVGERITSLLTLIQELQRVVNFQAAAQATLPGVIVTHHMWTPWKRSSVLRGILLYVRQMGGNHQRNLILLTRWLPKAEARGWCRGALRHPADLLQYGNLRKRVLEEHCSLVRQFDRIISRDDLKSGKLFQYHGLGMAMSIHFRYIYIKHITQSSGSTTSYLIPKLTVRILSFRFFPVCTVSMCREHLKKESTKELSKLSCSDESFATINRTEPHETQNV